MQQCLTALMTMIKSGHGGFTKTPCCVSNNSLDVVVSNAVLVLKSLVQTQLQVPLTPGSSTQPPLAIISHLARRIDDIRHSQARACVLWLVGQYSEIDTNGEGIADWAPDVLRKTAKTFGNEVGRVRSLSLKQN
jgi:AP-3 complex subunit beta